MGAGGFNLGFIYTFVSLNIFQFNKIKVEMEVTCFDKENIA